MNAKRKRRGIYRISKRYRLIRIRRRRRFYCFKKIHQRKKIRTDQFDRKGKTAMFEWIGDAVEWVGEKLFGVVESVGSAISSAVWDVMLEWMYDTIYGAVADLFGMINGMGAGIFSLAWVEAFLKLFSLFGWALFAVGLVVAVFDTAIEYQTGRANIQGTCLNVLKGFMAVMLFTQLPVELYKFCITLQSTFSGDLLGSFYRGEQGRSRSYGDNSTALYDRFIRTAWNTDGYRPCLLRSKAAFCQYKKRRNTAVSDCRGKSVYVFPFPEDTRTASAAGASRFSLCV